MTICNKPKDRGGKKGWDRSVGSIGGIRGEHELRRDSGVLVGASGEGLSFRVRT